MLASLLILAAMATLGTSHPFIFPFGAPPRPPMAPRPGLLFPVARPFFPLLPPYIKGHGAFKPLMPMGPWRQPGFPVPPFPNRPPLFGRPSMRPWYGDMDMGDRFERLNERREDFLEKRYGGEYGDIQGDIVDSRLDQWNDYREKRIEGRGERFGARNEWFADRNEARRDRMEKRNEYLADRFENRNEYSGNRRGQRNEYFADLHENRNDYFADRQENRNDYFADRQENRNDYFADQLENRNSYIPDQRENRNDYFAYRQENRNGHYARQRGRNGNGYFGNQQNARRFGDQWENINDYRQEQQENRLERQEEVYEEAMEAGRSPRFGRGRELNQQGYYEWQT